MTEEELKAFNKALASDEGKKVVSGIVDEAVKGLKSKNDELLGKLKDEKESGVELSKRLDGIEADKKKAEEEAIMKTGDVEKITQQLKDKHSAELAAKDEALAGKDGLLNKHIVGQGLTDALVKAGVGKNYLDAAKALINNNYKGEVGDNDGTPFAKFDGKNVTEFVTDWASSEQGKHFVKADQNSGGGSNGANGGGKAPGATTMARSDFENLSPLQKRDFSVKGGTLTE